MKIVLALLAITVAVFIAGTPMSLALWPLGSPEFRPWQLLTYAFLHGSTLHLVINMIALLSFGPTLTRDWGWRKFLTCYGFAALLGGALQAAIVDRPVVGASAALCGLFMAWVVANPHRKVVSFLVVPMSAWKVLLAYVLLTVLALAFDWATNVAHAAHLGGMAAGALFAINNKPRR